MNETLIQKLIKKIALRRLRISMAFLLVSFGVLAFHNVKIYNYFFNIPEINSVSEINQAFSSGKKFITIKNQEIFDTGYFVTKYETEIKDPFVRLYLERLSKHFVFSNDARVRRIKTFFFGIIETRDGFFIIKAPYRIYGRELKNLEPIGKLIKMDKEVTNVVKNLTPRNIKNMTEEKFLARFPSAYIDVSYDYLFIDRLKIVVSFIVFCISLVLVLISRRALKNHHFHSLYKGLNKFGDSKEIEQRIEAELVNSKENVIAESQTCYIGKEFIVGFNGSCAVVTLTEDLLWAFKRVTKAKRLFMKAKTVVMVYLMFDKHKEFFFTTCDENEADEFIKTVYKRLDIVVGYSAELNSRYKKNKKEFKK